MTSAPLDWSQIAAPSINDFDLMARDAYSELPADFRRLCEGLIIRVEDFPDDETLREMECDTEFDLLGLFRGRGLAQGAASAQTGQFPNMIWLYRRPILDFWADQDDALGAIITHVLVHEIGHHFGLSDADMEAIEKASR
jgi:predicted Zn-dependent protease with MMP-like domain